MKEITTRLWENQKFGTTFGKGLYRRAIYNGTVEISNPHAKYLVDFEQAEHWYHFPKSDAQIAIVNKLGSAPSNVEGVLLSWIMRYKDGLKTPVGGFAEIDLNKGELYIHIEDPDMELDQSWELKVRACSVKTPGKPTPALLATNCDL